MSMCGRLRCRALLWAGLLVAALCVDAQPFGPAHLAVPAAQMPHERGWPAPTTPANSTQLRWLHLLSAPLALPVDGDGAVVRSVSLAPLATLADVAAQHRRAPRYSVALRFQLPATVGSSATPSNAAVAALAAALPGRTCALLHRLDFHRANLETPGLLINPGRRTLAAHFTFPGRRGEQMHVALPQEGLLARHWYQAALSVDESGLAQLCLGQGHIPDIRIDPTRRFTRSPIAYHPTQAAWIVGSSVHYPACGGFVDDVRFFPFDALALSPPDELAAFALQPPLRHRTVAGLLDRVLCDPPTLGPPLHLPNASAANAYVRWFLRASRLARCPSPHYGQCLRPEPAPLSAASPDTCPPTRPSASNVIYTNIQYLRALQQDTTRRAVALFNAGALSPANLATATTLFQRVACAATSHDPSPATAEAAFYLGVLHSSGLIAEPQHPLVEETAAALFLHAAQQGHLLAQMALAHRHAQGIPPFAVADPTQSYAYLQAAMRRSIADVRDLSGGHLNNNICLSDKRAVELYGGEESSEEVQYIKHLAEHGDTWAEHRYGQMLYWGSSGVARDLKLAAVFFERAALKDHAEAAYTLGVMHRYAQGVPRNMTLTLKFFTIAANLDYAPAYNGLGAYFLDEEHDRVRANEFFKLAAKMGSPDGAFNLASSHLNQSDASAYNLTRAMSLFRKAAHGGHLEGQQEVAIRSIKGLGVREASAAQAVEYARPVAEHGTAIGNLMHHALKAYLDDDEGRALQLYLVAGETGLTTAQLNAALLAAEAGHPQLILRYWRMAALSAPAAKVQLAHFYWFGQYLERNQTHAKVLYAQAAEQGEPEAVFNLGWLTETGFAEEASTTPQARRRRARDIYLRCYDETPCFLAFWKVEVLLLLDRLAGLLWG